MNKELMVRARDLTRLYEIADTTSSAGVKNATFDIREGDRIALVGPSGSGKSTLLHLIGGLDTADSGSIEWPSLGAPPVALRPGPVAFAFQGPSLLAPLDVTENVEFVLLLQGVSEKQARESASEMIDRCGLSEVSSRFPEELSGGQAQRVGIARALAGRPQLLLADEPTGQQDRASGMKIIDVILSCMNEIEGSSIVIATHDSSVVSRLSSHWRIADGRLKTNDPIARADSTI